MPMAEAPGEPDGGAPAARDAGPVEPAPSTESARAAPWPGAPQGPAAGGRPPGPGPAPRQGP
ncbi:MAG: hypothetical protein DIU76_07905 [Bacillota bacterium]|nr:MAG: hypothetical protein DIU76_07905 [Bacillota bacterium]